jgi:hypothetical protein
MNPRLQPAMAARELQLLASESQAQQVQQASLTTHNLATLTHPKEKSWAEQYPDTTPSSAQHPANTALAWRA